MKVMKSQSGETDLTDLVEFRFDNKIKKFVKNQTHLTNVPKALSYGMKKRLSIGKSLHTRFRVVKNGELQYSNQFKST